MRLHRLVLLALAAPILGVAAVLWFLLPGSVAGLAYSPAQFDREAVLRPLYWSEHDVTLRGYARQPACSRSPCPVSVVLGDDPAEAKDKSEAANPTQDVVLLPQRESGWHSLLRHAVPQLMAAPVGPAASSGRRITVTGRLVAGYSPGQVPVIQPNPL